MNSKKLTQNKIDIRKIWYYFTRHIDGFLLTFILVLMSVGLMVLYSASGGNIGKVNNQAINIVVALILMWVIANTSMQQIKRIALPIYSILLSPNGIGTTLGKLIRSFNRIDILEFRPQRKIHIVKWDYFKQDADYLNSIFFNH